jgi:hypothetical protein
LRLAAFAVSASAALLAIVLVVMGLVIAAGRANGAWLLAATLTVLALAALAASIIPVKRYGAAVALAVVALAVSVAAADRRDPWEKFLEETGPLAAPEALIGDAKNVYWEEGVELLWFRMHRASYYSCIQGTGAMFYRQTALEYQRRGDVLSTIDTADFTVEPGTICPMKRDVSLAGPRSAADVVRVCRMLPDLDMLVLMTNLPQRNPPSWRAPAPQVRLWADGHVDRPTQYYFYDCRKLRQQGA